MKRLLRSKGGNKRDKNTQPATPVPTPTPTPTAPAPTTPAPTTPSSNPRIRRQHADTVINFHPNERIEPMGRSQLGFSEANNRSVNGVDGAIMLPSAWQIENAAFRHRDPLCIAMNSSSKTTVYANAPIPRTILQTSRLGGGGTRRQRSNGTSSALYPNPDDPGDNSFGISRVNPSAIQVYYFEVTVVCSHPSSFVEIAIGLACERSTHEAWPGELHNSIGWGSDGLNVNGRRFGTNQNRIPFHDGVTIGCGIEVGDSQRVFFTRNGRMEVPPSPNTSFSGARDLPCYPVVSFRQGNGDMLNSNFGLDIAQPLQWAGTDRLRITSAQPGRNQSYAASMDSSPLIPPSEPMFRSTGGNGGRSGSPSYYNMRGLDTLDDPLSNGIPLTRSMPPRLGSVQGRHGSGGSGGPLNELMGQSDIGNSSVSDASFYGVKNHRKSLVDDDPADVNATTNQHFSLSPSGHANPSSPQIPRWPAGRGPPKRAYSSESSSRYSGGDPSDDPMIARMNEGSNRRDLRRQERASRRARDGLSMSGHQATTKASSPSTNSPNAMTDSIGRVPMSLPTPRSNVGSDDLFRAQPKHDSPSAMSDSTSRAPMSLPTPRSNVGYNNRILQARKKHEEANTPRDNSTNSASIAVASDVGGQIKAAAMKNSEVLRKISKGKDIDFMQVRELLDICKNDQAKLQLKLNNALEEADDIDNLEELFAVNDGICSAIDAAHEALKKERKKKNSVEGPTIEVLVENEDIFSLICMLRAPTEKKVAATLALMKFARENEILRNEIRSSGGMHSFLTLFRTKGTTKELQVVASMAVAYVLPSFVVSSQTSSSVGLKIIDCLRFLVTAQPVSPQNVVLARDDMIKAASVGVNVLWINAIQPLIVVESAKAESKQNRPTLRHNTSMKFGRLRGRLGGSMFDQGQESIEIRELTELAVTLIAHIAKLSNNPGGMNLVDVGYNIVEQVCEVDAARHIVVREGLLKTLVEWIRSKDVDKVRPAASALRYLISIEDKYMAGWIHSQVVNEDAIREIVKLLNESVGHDVRVAVAQMISALCVAPHTRAAVVEANCVSYLVALLYEHSAPASEEMVTCAASALLQLAAGAMVQASALSSNILSVEAPTPDKQETVITEMIEGWAHSSFVQIAMIHKGKLRSVSVEALRVLSEDTSETRQTRLQLCCAGAAEALGKTLKDDSVEIRPLKPSEHYALTFNASEGSLHSSVKDVHEALCGLANMLEPHKQSSRAQLEKRPSGTEKGLSGTYNTSPKETLIRGCLDMVKSGGMDCLIWIASLPYSQSPRYENSQAFQVDRMDLVDEACRLLANLSPLLLSNEAAAEGCTRWASDVFEALHGILERVDEKEDDATIDSVVEVNIDALRGLGALARYEPLKIRIVDKSLPKLLALKTLGGDKNDLSNSASQVLLSLGFTENEIAVQVAGNNPKLLVDWFCLQRALLLQAMARAELRAKVIEMWELPFTEFDGANAMKLMRQASVQSNTSSHNSEDRSIDSEENAVMQSLFDNFTEDMDSLESRESLLQQYRDLYTRDLTKGNHADSSGLILDETTRSNFLGQSFRSNGLDQNKIGDSSSLMTTHVFPLNDVTTEKDWVLSHQDAVGADSSHKQKACHVGAIPERIEKLLDCCFPSRLLRYDVFPFADFRPQSSFNFRALMMPQRRYFSFRREGQLLARLCEKQAAFTDTDEVHWKVGFTNSTFAGEFVASLVQTLYLCPMITGLSFAHNTDWLAMRNAEAENEGEEGGGLLANLTGSLPPWVSFLTFDNVLNDRDLRALVAIIDTMGKLSSGIDDDDTTVSSTLSVGQTQGKFSSLAIRNSPQVSRESWQSLFDMLGKSALAKRGPVVVLPLFSLTVLDLSGNKLGDELSAKVLELVHDKDSECNLEQLDLSGNRIGRGINIVRVLRSYIEYYRYNQQIGARLVRSSWKSSLHTLILAENDLHMGQAGLEIFDLLKQNAMCLRFLDLSNNGLEGDTYQLLTSSLLKNTSLCHLNLSGNKFSSPLIDLILEHINRPDAESGLSFLLFENNTPPLNPNQQHDLSKFLRRSRKNAIERFMKEQENGLPDEVADISQRSERNNGLELISENSSRLFRKSFSAHRRRMLPPEVEESLEEDVEEGDNMITVLFSAPLVFADDHNELHPFAKLDFDMERELLWQCLKEASRDIKVTFDNAHHSRLLATLTKRCSCLHYSGHGHPNFLPFEDGMGGPNWLNVQDIKELILRDGAAPFKFVFVSACHSGLAGETFASAGVPHVVCCQQEEELKDTAALAFTRSFYLALAVGNTVKESFEQGCKAVRATPNLKDPAKEMEKFVLLPKNGNHDVPVFNAKHVREWPKQPRNHGMVSSRSKRRASLMRMRSVMALGAKSSELSTRNMMQEDPSPAAPQFFIGREVDMYYILTALLKMKKRLVNVLGEPGIGRSSLVCALCHYINERASTITEIQRIYFIKPKHGGRNVSCRSLLRQLLDKLEEDGKCRPIDEDSDTEAMLDIISRSLKNVKALIVFDRTELLEKSDDAQELPMILSTLLYDTKQVKVILTGRHPLGQPSIGGQVEHPFNLGPVNFANSVRLFANLCPHLHTPSERGLFVAEVIANCKECSELFPGDHQMSNSSKEILALVGDGFPAKIENAAYSTSKEDLKLLHCQTRR